jgi:hypothetical protein
MGLASSLNAIMLEDMNSTMDTSSKIADLSKVLPGELWDAMEMPTEDELLAADPEFAEWLENRQEESLAYQMASEADDFYF